VTEKLVDVVLRAAGEHNAYLSSNKIFQSYSETDTHLYFKDLFSWLDRKNTDKKRQKQSKTSVQRRKIMRIDVSDDFFFLKLLTALGYRMDAPILPGSRLVIEQYKKSKVVTSARYLKVIVDGRVVTGSLSSCSGSGGGDLCGVDTMLSHLEERRVGSLFGVCEEPRGEL
jgi:hypothetical protein